MTAAETAIVTLRRCLAALTAPGLTPDDREHVAALAAAALQLLETAGRRRVAAERLAVRVHQLETALADRDPRERREAIMQRLGLSRSAYYRARSHSPGTAAG